MKNIIIEAKLNSLALSLERLELKTPKSLKELKSNIDLQDILIVNLERLIQTSVDIALIMISDRKISENPVNMSDSFEVLSDAKLIPSALALRLKKSVGFRNICVHEYKRIDWDIVFAILTKHLKDFKDYAGRIEKLNT